MSMCALRLDEAHMKARMIEGPLVYVLDLVQQEQNQREAAE